MNRRGFTLIELLIVIMIIGLLAVIALPKYGRSRERAHDAAAVADLRNLITMSEAYYADHNGYPESEGDLGDITLSDGVVIDRFNRETTEGYSVVHIHVYHENSSNYFHVEFPVEPIEKRKR